MNMLFTQQPDYATTLLFSTPPPLSSLPPLPLLHPVFAVVGIVLLVLIGSLMSRVIPFYRRELKVEAAMRLTPLDGLRGILCFAVLFHHAAVTYDFLDTGLWTAPPSAFYQLLGTAAVGFFFCVTGLLFWSRALATAGQLQTVPFLRARFFRIVPLYAFSCLLAIVLVARQVHWASFSALRGLIQMGLMGLRQWGPLGSVDLGPVNAGVTWTLQYEWGFYLALPALALVARGKSMNRMLLLALGIFVIFGDGYYMYFLPGMIAAHALRRPRIVQRLCRPEAAICVLLLLASLPFLTHDGYGYRVELLVGLAFLPIACGNDIFGLLNLKGLRLLGLISYSVYLLHGFGLYIARPLLIHAKTAGDGSVLKYWACIYAIACAVLILCMLTYRWVELPFIQFEKRLRAPRRKTQSAQLVPVEQV
jgi:peptidoglycan/LPS O-acetylase OafA/YrhL